MSSYLFVLYIALLMSGYLFVLYIALLMSGYLLSTGQYTIQINNQTPSPISIKMTPWLPCLKFAK
jgi:hypothetical protein